MIDRLIHLLGGVPKAEYDEAFKTITVIDQDRDRLRNELQHERELLTVANAIIDKIEPRKFCTKTPGCAMEEGHGMDCREWHGLTFGTARRKELRRKRQERETAEVGQ